MHEAPREHFGCQKFMHEAQSGAPQEHLGYQAYMHDTIVVPSRAQHAMNR